MMKAMRAAAYSLMVAVVAAAACSAADEATDHSTSVPDSGSLRFALEVAPGVTIDAIDYEITGDGMSPLGGSLDVGTGVGNTFVAFLDGIPAGLARHLVMMAHTSEGATCRGDVTVDIAAGETTVVTLILRCRADGGAVLVNGSIDQCPFIRSLVAAPASAPLGETIHVVVEAEDADDGLTTAWSASSGSFVEPAAASTAYSCEAPGTHALTVTATDAAGCQDSASVEVTCGSGGGNSCGDGVIAGGEACDDANLGGETCASVTMNALPAGELACSPRCTFDITGCQASGDAGGSGGLGGSMGGSDAGGTMGGGGLGGIGGHP